MKKRNQIKRFQAWDRLAIQFRRDLSIPLSAHLSNLTSAPLYRPLWDMKMKLFLAGLLLVLTVGCQGPPGKDGLSIKGARGEGGAPGDTVVGPPGERGHAGAPGASCTVSAANNGAIIACPDGSVTLVTNGNNGANGTNGQDGASIVGPQGGSCEVVQNEGSAIISCSDGTSAQITNGKDGLQGLPGHAGASCTVGTGPTNGATIQCSDGSSATISNGAIGPQGPAGLNAILEVIDPCGDETDFDEVLLRLADNTLIAIIESKHDYATVIRPGTYRTSDGTNCIFTVTADGRIL